MLLCIWFLEVASPPTTETLYPKIRAIRKVMAVFRRRLLWALRVETLLSSPMKRPARDPSPSWILKEP
jgi:hypothetical protein